PAYHASLGARMEMGQIVALRKGSPADQSKKLRPLDPEKSPHGDIIQLVEVTEPDGTVTRYGPPLDLVGALFAPPWVRGAAIHRALQQHYKPLDPARLPDQLLDWSMRMAKAGKGKQRVVTLHVRGPNPQNGDQELEPQSRAVKLKWDADWEDNIELPMSLNSPLSIPGLGLAYRIKTRVAGVDPTPAEARGPGEPLAKAWAALRDALGTNALR